MKNIKIEIPKEELYQKYIHENLSRKECAVYFNVTEKAVTRRLGEYGIKKDRQSIQKVKERIFLSRYGNISPFSSKEIRNKIQKTMLERYGVKFTAQSKELQSKMQETMLKHYGKKNYVETEEFQKKSMATCKKKYGVNWPCQFPHVIKSLENAIGHSKPEQAFANLLKSYNIEFEQEFPLRGFKYDFKIGNFLVEINPSCTHNANFGLFGNKPKPKTYHFTKHCVAKEFGYHCLHVFDWDDQDKIIQTFFIPKQTIYARNTEVRIVSTKDTKSFVDIYHLQGYAKSEINIGLYEKGSNSPIQIMTFGKPRYNKHYEYELIRLCSSKNVIGGAQKLLNYFVKQYNPTSIVSYCDLSKFDGNIYKQLGFKAKNKPSPSKHWVNLFTNEHITDNLLRQRGFDQLFHTHFGKGTSNQELMYQAGFVEVYDVGQVTYIYKLN